MSQLNEAASGSDHESIEIPPSERAAVTSMATAFKDAVKAVSKESSKPTAASVETTKPVEAKAEKPPEQKDPSRENFKALESDRDRWKNEATKLKPQFDATTAERDRLKAELETVKKGGTDYEQLKTNLAERDLLLKQFALEKHPQFQKHFSERMQAALSEARDAVGEDAAGEIEKILQLPPSSQRDTQIEELAEVLNLSDMRRLDLLDAYKNLKRTEKERQAELARAPENFKVLQEMQTRQAIEEGQKAAQNRAILLQHINAQIAPDLNGADPALAKTIQASVFDMVEGRGGAERYVETVVNAAKWQRHQGTITEQAATIAKLEAQLDELQTTQPSLTGAGETSMKTKREPEDLGPKFRRLRDGAGTPKGNYQPV